MKAFVLLLSLLAISMPSRGQHFVIDGVPKDSVVFSFNTNDTLYRFLLLHQDSLWMHGNTTKPYFADTGATHGMMTDTTASYFVNANQSLAFVAPNNPGFAWSMNPIISFWHKYQTGSLDGGVVEFSLDSGVTWENVKGPCNVDDAGFLGIRTENFYSKVDTLSDGSLGFTGVSTGWKYSRFQYFHGYPIKQTGDVTTSCQGNWHLDLIFRFRFVSDSIPDSLDGWILGAIIVEYDGFNGGLADKEAKRDLEVYPNPSSDGRFEFPVIDGSESYVIDIWNQTGRKIHHGPYVRQLNLQNLPAGIYYYRAGDDAVQYSGKLMIAR